MEHRIDRLAMRQGVMDETEVSARRGRVELEIRDWMDVIRMIVPQIDLFSEKGGELLIACRFERGPEWRVVKEEPVSMIRHMR